MSPLYEKLPMITTSLPVRHLTLRVQPLESIGNKVISHHLNSSTLVQNTVFSSISSNTSLPFHLLLILIKVKSDHVTHCSVPSYHWLSKSPGVKSILAFGVTL